MADPDDKTTQPSDEGNAADQNQNGSDGKERSRAPRSISGLDPETQEYIKTLRKENEQRRTELKDAREALDRHKADADEAAKAAITAAEGKASAAEARLLRFEVAAETGLPLKLANRLQGNTLEEMKKDAEALKEEFSLADDGTMPTGGSSFDGGVRRSTSGKPQSMNGLMRELAGRR